MRDVTHFMITHQYQRIAKGNARLTNYEIEYTYPVVEGLCETKLNFNVVPDSNPPTNIHVVIGRNNVGKTYLIKNILSSIYSIDDGIDHGILRATNDSTGRLVRARKQVFANVAKTLSEYLMPGTTGLNHTQSQSEFMLNKALIISNGDWICSEMADAPMADGFEWAAAPALKLNEDDTAYYQLSGAGFGIPTAAENQELAKEFVRFFYTDQCQRYMCEAGMVCCTKNFLEVAEDLIPEEKKPFLSLSDSAAGFSLNYVAVDSKLAPETTMFDGLTAIANGDMDAETWRQNTIDVFNRVAAGE